MNELCGYLVTYDQDPVVALQAVKLIQEVRSHFLLDKRVDILKDEQARCHTSGLFENHSDTELRHVSLIGESPHIERRNRDLGQSIDERLNADSLAVTVLRSVEDSRASDRNVHYPGLPCKMIPLFQATEYCS